jgi:pimeloyl-ACP methyl ester carboxylesterase
VQSTPTWDAGTQYLVGHGYAVMQVNYRGSSGYGRAFEEAGTHGDLAVSDVLVGCQELARAADVAPERVVVLGVRYGASLVLRAAAQNPEAMSGIVLVSLAGDVSPATTMTGSPPQLAAFHGARDAARSPAGARRTIGRVFAGELTWRNLGSWDLLSDEGHMIVRPDSWARIYAAILRM